MPKEDDGAKTAIEELGKTTPAPSTPAANAVRPVFKFLPPEEYRGANPANLYDQSLAQQLAAAGGHPADFNYNPWDFTEDALVGEESSGDNFPFPGKGSRMFAYPSTTVLHRLDDTAPGDIKPTADKAEPRPFTFFACDLDAAS